MVLTVHIIPHTHTDPGWLQTYDNYYSRSVRGILNTVVGSLIESPNRTFAWSEVCYFARWYAETSARRRRDVRALVTAGRLEFVGGGWVQHDEALPTVGAALDNMAEGHEWLRKTFGIAPTVGWQLDTFGHTAANAALMAQMGLDALVINRIHFQLKRQWRTARHLEFMWKASGDAHVRGAPLLTHVLHTHYSCPRGFDFESSGFRPADLAVKAAELRKLVLTERVRAYRTPQLMLLVGDDFRWGKAGVLYRDWEQLIARARVGSPTIDFRLSTPSRYFAGGLCSL